MEDRELSNDEINEIVDKSKREFIKKFGTYATTLPAGVLVLMSAGTSKAHASSDTESTTSPIDSIFGW